jgi:hypothetical protein
MSTDVTLLSNCLIHNAITMMRHSGNDKKPNCELRRNCQSVSQSVLALSLSVTMDQIVVGQLRD